MTNLDEKKLDDFVNKKMESEAAKYHGWGTSARQAYIYGYTQAVADQQKKIEKLKKAVEVMRCALDKHYEYAEECRADWSEYDGRTHLHVATKINSETLDEVDAILKEGN